MNRQTLRIADRKFQVGATHLFTNGNRVTIERIWDHAHDGQFVTYKLDDGRTGDSTPNSLYWSIDWAATASPRT